MKMEHIKRITHQAALGVMSLVVLAGCDTGNDRRGLAYRQQSVFSPSPFAGIQQVPRQPSGPSASSLGVGAGGPMTPNDPNAMSDEDKKALASQQIQVSDKWPVQQNLSQRDSWFAEGEKDSDFEGISDGIERTPIAPTTDFVGRVAMDPHTPNGAIVVGLRVSKGTKIDGKVFDIQNQIAYDPDHVEDGMQFTTNMRHLVAKGLDPSYAKVEGDVQLIRLDSGAFEAMVGEEMFVEETSSNGLEKFYEKIAIVQGRSLQAAWEGLPWGVEGTPDDMYFLIKQWVFTADKSKLSTFNIYGPKEENGKFKDGAILISDGIIRLNAVADNHLLNSGWTIPDAIINAVGDPLYHIGKQFDNEKRQAVQATPVTIAQPEVALAVIWSRGGKGEGDILVNLRSRNLTKQTDEDGLGFEPIPVDRMCALPSFEMGSPCYVSKRKWQEKAVLFHDLKETDKLYLHFHQGAGQPASGVLSDAQQALDKINPKIIVAAASADADQHECCENPGAAPAGNGSGSALGQPPPTPPQPLPGEGGATGGAAQSGDGLAAQLEALSRLLDKHAKDIADYLTNIVERLNNIESTIADGARVSEMDRDKINTISDKLDELVDEDNPQVESAKVKVEIAATTKFYAQLAKKAQDDTRDFVTSSTARGLSYAEVENFKNKTIPEQHKFASDLSELKVATDEIVAQIAAVERAKAPWRTSAGDLATALITESNRTIRAYMESLHSADEQTNIIAEYSLADQDELSIEPEFLVSAADEQAKQHVDLPRERDLMNAYVILNATSRKEATATDKDRYYALVGEIGEGSVMAATKSVDDFKKLYDAIHRAQDLDRTLRTRYNSFRYNSLSGKADKTDDAKTGPDQDALTTLLADNKFDEFIKVAINDRLGTLFENKTINGAIKQDTQTEKPAETGGGSTTTAPQVPKQSVKEQRETLLGWGIKMF